MVRASANESPGESDGAAGLDLFWKIDLSQPRWLVVWWTEKIAPVAAAAGGVKTGGSGASFGGA